MEILTLSLSIVSILSLGLFFNEHRRHRKLSSKTPFVNPEANQLNQNSLIHDAIKKSQAILTEAELAAIKEISKSKLQNNKYLEGYDREFEETLNQIYSHLNQRIGEIESKFASFVTELEENAKQNNQKIDASFATLIKEIGVKLEDNMKTFLEETQKKSVQQLQMELSSARQVIDTYKTTQMRLIDENILAVLERTLALVLNKNLPLQDQLDLISDAFDQAKKEKFFI